MGVFQAQENLLDAFEKILTPLVHVYLKFGGSYELYEEVARRVFIKVATQHFKPPDNRVKKRARKREVTDSRISIVTGMPRYSVSETRKRMTKKENVVVQYGKSAIVSAWMSDPDFTDDKGAPRDLLEQSEPGFSSLVETCARKEDFSSVKDQLIEMGVCEARSNKIELVNPEKVTLENKHYEVVQCWQTNTEYTDRWGRPKILPLKTLPGFYDLCKRYKGNIQGYTVFKELLQLGVIKQIDNQEDDTSDEQLITLVTSGIIPKDSRPALIYWGGENVANHLNTIVNNILNPVDSELIEKSVLVMDTPKEFLSASHALANKEGYKMLLKLDAAYIKQDRETNPDVQGTGRYKVGCGIYYFQQDISEAKD